MSAPGVGFRVGACDECGAADGEYCRMDCTGLVSALAEIEDATNAGCERCGKHTSQRLCPACLASALNEIEDATAATAVECFHCARTIVYDPEAGWIDPEATGDDSVWRETCDAHDTFRAEHEPKQAGLGVGHIWTAVACPAYRTTNPGDCTCRNAR